MRRIVSNPCCLAAICVVRLAAAAAADGRSPNESAAKEAEVVDHKADVVMPEQSTLGARAKANLSARVVNGSSSPGFANSSLVSCRHGSIRHAPQGNATCACTWPREAMPNPNGSIDCALTHCGHGNFSFEQGQCACSDGWRHAGISNPWSFFNGRCTQYQCKSDALCEELLGIPGAMCPMPGWNCDCGLYNSMFATASAECMYPWWALASKATRGFIAMFRSLWYFALLVSAALLPFGKNVRGSAERYSCDLLQHDLAWSLFALKLGCWLYAFSTVTFVCLGLFAASAAAMLILSALVVTIVVACCMALIAMTGEGGAAACDVGEICTCQGECLACEFADCCGTAAGGECCCCCGAGAPAADMGPMMFYSYDPCLWYYPLYYDSSDRDCLCCCGFSDGGARRRCTSCFLMIPCFRALAAVLPRLPENMLGGLFGFCIGTHPLRNRYEPNSRLVRSLARPCWSMSNRGDRWRRAVYEWLHERDAFEAQAQTGVAVAEPEVQAGSGRVVYGGVQVVREQGCFSAVDGIFNFDDYSHNECWICQQGGEQWDMWVSCRHAFCQRCSGEMLRRQMPCPLCRVRSGYVIRRQALPPGEREFETGKPAELGNLIPSELPLGASVGQRRAGAVAARARSPANAPQPQTIPPLQDA